MAMDISGIIRTGPDSAGLPAKEGGNNNTNSPPVVKTEPQVLETEVSVEDLKKAIEEFKLTTDHVDKRLKFRVSDEIGRVVVTIIDRSTGDVLKEIPSKEIQRLHDHIREAMGVLFDRKI